MKRALVFLVVLGSLLAVGQWSRGLARIEAATPFEAPRGFETWEVWLEGYEGELGAWQAEIRDLAGEATLVGIEGGEHPAFREPARYDPAALQGGLVVLAAFSADEDLPEGPTRVASLHVMTNDGQPDWKATLEVAIDGAGADLPATLRLVRKP